MSLLSRVFSMRGVAIAGALSAFGTSVPALAEAPTGAPVDGIRCDQMEGANFHIHQHLTILDHGKPVTVPDNIGRPAVAGCFYWLHTHTPDGLIHIESPMAKSFTLGNFFDVWGEPLTPTAVASARIKKGQLRVFVGGSPYSGDPRKIELAQHSDITLEAGPPYSKPAAFTDWQGQ